MKTYFLILVLLASIIDLIIFIRQRKRIKDLVKSNTKFKKITDDVIIECSKLAIKYQDSDRTIDDLTNRIAEYNIELVKTKNTINSFTSETQALHNLIVRSIKTFNAIPHTEIYAKQVSEIKSIKSNYADLLLSLNPKS